MATKKLSPFAQDMQGELYPEVVLPTRPYPPGLEARLAALKASPLSRWEDPYSLYLVTDSTKPILGDRNLVDVVRRALKGGVTCVQYRDKTSDTGELIRTARALHKECVAFGVPLLINDRVDVALAVGCEGVHVGQDDMSVKDARRLLGEDALIGCTVSSVGEAQAAVDQGADYLGIGTLYSTETKKNSKSIIGINGVRKILRFLERHEDGAAQNMKTVVIGGINASNIQLVKHQLSTPSPEYTSAGINKTIDGVAIVSAIIAAEDPKAAARRLSTLWSSPAPFGPGNGHPPMWFDRNEDEMKIIHSVTRRYTEAVNRLNPISHNMTNTVVANLAAQIAIAIGASPIMSNIGAEAADLARLQGSLVINMGTLTPETLANQIKAIKAYNAVGAPVILDPVGAGATTERKHALDLLMASGYFDIIKGNESEIVAVAKASGLILESYPEREKAQQYGVDSGKARYELQERAYIVSRLAARERNIVVMTSVIDVISDGTRTYAIRNGHQYLGMVTGSGCSLGTVMSAYVAAARRDPDGDRLHAAMAGILHYEIAAECACENLGQVTGPGTFIPVFIDQLMRQGLDALEGNTGYIDKANVTMIKNIQDFKYLKEDV